MSFFLFLTSLVGGLALFIFGTNLISDGLRKAAALEVQKILGTFTRNRIAGMLVGLVVTVFLQTSAVTSVLLVGFVSAGLMTLEQALGVILGAAIGSTVTVQLIVFRITDYAPWALVLGLLPYLLARRRRWRYLGQAVVGFGLLFYGVATMSSAVQPLKDYPGWVVEMQHLASRPWLLFVAATLFTAIVQSSAAPVALAISLAGQEALSLEPALAVVLGANVGTTATGILSSLGASWEAKRVAWGHFFFKVTGALLFLPFLSGYARLLEWTSPDLPRQIANGHTIFNVVNMLIFLPFTPYMSKILERLLPEQPKEEKIAKYLDETLLEVPELALSRVRQEILRMAGIIRGKMFPQAMQPLPLREEGLLRKLKEVDDVLDFLYQAIARYLARISPGDEREEVEKARLLYIANDLEHIGDVMVQIARQWRKMEESGLVFSVEGQSEMEEMYKLVQENFDKAVEAFASVDHNLAVQVIKQHPALLKMEKTLRFNHFQRLQQENRLSLETTAVHMDLINYLLRVNSHTVSIAQAVLGII
ncbi:MAG: Na/Pi cotransporter family protein [Thermanaeromonas sp.]|uniref:Na/Pi cotransporter family protein n=1 Tax=Thermanaeromonas sp. TaxID=2003697 RepID=UPI002437E178|nr:Na/Pi cotransporter family protein [Thermanaeromonas sp.]MCG0277775.1 Na/Pi cotransporter family protein [Thermanaeromonas sp.]